MLASIGNAHKVNEYQSLISLVEGGGVSTRRKRRQTKRSQPSVGEEGNIVIE